MTTATGSSTDGMPRSALAVLLVVSASLMVAQPAANAVLEPEGYMPIQPGAPIHAGAGHPLSGTPFGVCTMNFVFRGREVLRGRGAGHRHVEHTYIGDAGHCVHQVGQRVSAPGIGEFGTVVFRVACSWRSPCEGRPMVDDFALIRVDTDKLQMVSPVVRGVGRAPSGSTTSDETSTGDLLVVHGQGSRFSLAEPGRTGYGVLEYDDPLSFRTTLLGPTHSASPVLRVSDGKAIGIIATGQMPSALQGTPLENGGPTNGGPLIGGPTIEHIEELLADAGFDVHLVGPSSPRLPGPRASSS